MPSLYANLLDPKIKNAATISGEPVKYEFKKQEEPQEEKKKQDAALRFQPVKRPAVTQKPKPRPSAASTFSSAKSPDNVASAKNTTPQPTSEGGQKVTLDQFITKDDDDEGDPFAAEYNRRMEEARRANRRGGRKKKKNQRAGDSRWVDWDAIYDPAKPTRLDLYKGSDEQSQAIHDWKMRLHAHHLKDKPRHGPSSDEEDEYSRRPKQAFAPPPTMFAPPPSYDTPPAQDTESPRPPSPPRDIEEPYIPPAPAADVPNDASGEDAYMRRLRLSGMAPALASQSPPVPPSPLAPSQPPLPPLPTQQAPPPPPPIDQTFQPPIPSMPLPQTAPAPGTNPSPPPRQIPSTTNTTLSSAPIMYSAPPQLSTPSQTPPTTSSAPSPPPADPEDDEPRSSRPGQRGFAKRLLQKYGWQEGQGLGASGDGITTILRHQPEKRKKRPDAEGGGFIGPSGGMARIVGGKRQKTSTASEGQDAGEGGEWSVVAVFRGMLKGVDVQREMEEGSLMQDIGERMGEYGVVERLFLDRSGEDEGRGTRVFVKFTSALSAYRVVQASNGKEFLGNGRVVESGFFDAERFEEGRYD
ncbi:hypothetical protein KVT40_009301 [Elsinoe batatas]|uniref:G-patch domain-containing protein n=1 Tax=Elsinoe batatas TaxID=2601811 RepID=A0A8K0KT39_9PEZI|nr:hypothetical protein KVT40_009301 [Elsinoe batatas]